MKKNSSSILFRSPVNPLYKNYTLTNGGMLIDGGATTATPTSLQHPHSSSCTSSPALVQSHPPPMYHSVYNSFASGAAGSNGCWQQAATLSDCDSSTTTTGATLSTQLIGDPLVNGIQLEPSGGSSILVMNSMSYYPVVSMGGSNAQSPTTTMLNPNQVNYWPTESTLEGNPQHQQRVPYSNGTGMMNGSPYAMSHHRNSVDCIGSSLELNKQQAKEVSANHFDCTVK